MLSPGGPYDALSRSLGALSPLRRGDAQGGRWCPASTCPSGRPFSLFVPNAGGDHEHGHQGHSSGNRLFIMERNHKPEAIGSTPGSFQFEAVVCKPTAFSGTLLPPPPYVHERMNPSTGTAAAAKKSARLQWSASMKASTFAYRSGASAPTAWTRQAAHGVRSASGPYPSMASRSSMCLNSSSGLASPPRRDSALGCC